MIRAMRSGRYDRAISEISGMRARAQGDRWEIGALWGTRVMAVDVVAAWMGGWRSGGGGMGRARARGDRAAIRGVEYGDAKAADADGVARVRMVW